MIKKGYGGTGPSSAARYISFRDRDEQREGTEPRKLFSASKERLSASQANRLLGNGEEPKAKDVLHLVISLEKEEDFNRLGTEEASRQAGIRKTSRNAMKDVTDHFNADKLRWVAGIHRNTGNLHLHLLIHRDYVDRQTRRVKQLTAFQRDLRISWSSGPNGERITNPGVLSLAFEKHLERNIEKVRVDREKTEQKLREDSQVLGRAMLAEGAVERLKEMRDSAITLGDRRRYKIVDARGHSRWLSEHDLRLRAEAAADRTLARLSPGWLPDVKRRIRDDAFAEEMKRYEPVIQEIRQFRNADLEWAEMKWQQAMGVSRPLHWKVAAIQQEYESAGTAVPTPALTRDEMNRLQDRALNLGDAGRFRKLEEIRGSLAAEKRQPSRTDKEVGRLRAQLFVSQSSLAVEQKTLREFEETKHFRRWPLGKQERIENPFGNRTDRSLTEIERALAWESDQAKFIGARKLHWDDAQRSIAGEKAAALREQRELVLQKIADECTRLSSRITGKEELVEAMNEAFARETDGYHKRGLEMPEPIFTEQEMKELAVHADRRRDSQFYLELRQLERDRDARLLGGIPFVFADHVSQAKARTVMAGIAVREAQTALQRFADQRDQMTVIVKDDGGRNIRLGRMTDVRPRTPLEQLFRPLIERSETYREVVAAVEAYGNRLQQRGEEAAASHAILKEDAREQEQEFARWNPKQPMPRPQFTAWEIGRLELHAAKETDLALREQYEQLYREAIADRRDDSATREIEVRKESSRTIVLDEREAATIFGSAGVDAGREFEFRETRVPEREDSRSAMSFER
ncbi:MAG: hypothetical protein ACREEM_09715 [Blastocatellia bacterium]